MDRSPDLYIFLLIFNLFNPIVTTNVSSTPSADLSTVLAATSSTTISAPPPTPGSVSIKVTINPSSTTTRIPLTKIPRKEVEKIGIKPPSTQLLLDGERLKLNITALDNFVELSVIISNSSSAKIAGTAKRLLLALENDHYNVDVVSIPFSSDGPQVSLSNRIEDWSWNKRNGILLKDHAQSYKWILSGLESNNTLGTFITFQRKWQTCDVQDVHFGLSPMKIWWSFDNGTVKYENDKMRQELEKQQTGNSSASDLKNGTLTKTNKSIDATNVTTPTVAPSEEVEVLRSIKNSNFQGPVNFTFGDLLRNLTFFIMGCGESTTQFQCNASDIRKLQLANYSDLLSVGKISLKAFDSVKKDGKVQECSVAIDYANGGNEKKFHALFGFPKKSKGNKITQPDHAIFSVMIFIPYFLVQLSCSSDTCAPPCWY